MRDLVLWGVARRSPRDGARRCDRGERLDGAVVRRLQAEGRVKIPSALVPYFGKEFLSFK